MTQTQLKGFLAIVEHRSFTAAADRLYISQSALSQQMKTLERELGFALFDRSTRQVVLTEAGRSFYQSAQKMQELYIHAVAEGQQLQKMHQQHRKRLRIGCLGDQFFQIWQDLLKLAMPLAEQYAPSAVQYESRDALYSALLRGKAHIAALLESEDIQKIGLSFLPFARVPELCMPAAHLLAPEMLSAWQQHPVRLEELEGQLLAFHNHPGQNLYEDRLRHHLQENLSRYEYVDPAGFFTASYRPTTLLLPAIQYSGHALAVPLDWENGAVLGFVIAPNAEPKVLNYAAYIKEHLQPIPNFWTPLEA